MEDLVIRRWKESDSIDLITEILHLAYGALARQGMTYNASHQPPSQTLSRLKSGDAMIAEIGDKIVGTITMYHASDHSNHLYYLRPGLVYFGQFAVHPDFQRRGIARRLYQTVENHARALGATEIALDTAETAHELIAMYQRWGFEIVDTANWDSTNYISVIMAKPLN